MQKIVKPVFSVLIIAFFLLITLATDFDSILYESTNTTIKTENCEMKPEVSGKISVTVLLLDDEGDPVNNHDGLLFVTHQKVDSDTCTFVVAFNQTIPFTTNSQGIFVYDGPEWVHDNSQDLWRAEIKVKGDETYSSFKEVQVQYYDKSNFIFSGELKIFY